MAKNIDCNPIFSKLLNDEEKDVIFIKNNNNVIQNRSYRIYIPWRRCEYIRHDRNNYYTIIRKERYNYYTYINDINFNRYYYSIYNRKNKLTNKIKNIEKSIYTKNALIKEFELKINKLQ